MSLAIIIDQYSNLFCRTIAYRAEDISKRLEPQELYIREELEESVQFDVSVALLLFLKL